MSTGTSYLTCLTNSNKCEFISKSRVAVLTIVPEKSLIKRVAQGSNFVFEGSNRTILDLRGLFTDF